MVPPPKGKDLSRMSAPHAVSTISEPSPGPVVASPAAGLTATSPSPGGGGAPSPSPRTGKPKGKDFSRMSGPPPSSTNTPIPEMSQPPPTVPVSQPPMHLQNSDIQMQSTLQIPINNAVGMAGTNLATSSTAYAQSPPLVQNQPPQYQQFMPSAPVNFIQQQQQQQQQMQQQQQLQQQEQQQQQLQQQQQQQMQQLFHQQQQQQQLLQMQQLQQQMQQPQQQMQQMQLQNQHLQQSANVSLLNMPLKPSMVEPLLPTHRPSWSEARLSTMPNGSRPLSVVGSTGSNTAAPVSESTTSTTTIQQSTSPSNNNKTTDADTDTNDGYGKPSLAPVLGEKLQHLCHSIDPSYTLDSEVQERLVEMADAFVEKVTRDAIKLAKHRGSSCMDVVDVALALKKGYNLEVPGLGPPSVATGGLGVGGMRGRGTGNVMGGWMFADMVSLGEARGIVGGEGGQEPSPKKMKRGSSTNAM